MKTLRALPLLPLLAGLALSACENGTPTAPAMEKLAKSDEIALLVVMDPAATQILIDLAQIAGATTHLEKTDSNSTSADMAQVQALMQAAQDQYRSGNQAGALERLREGRRVVARAMGASGGPEVVEAMVERLQVMAITVANDPEEYQDPRGLRTELAALADAASDAWGTGDITEAGQLAVLGEQRILQGQQLSATDRAWYARLRVRLGASAVELASRLLEQHGASKIQLRFLEKAKKFQARAVDALEDGKLRQAVHFACLAKWWSLKAAVGPGKVSEAELRYMVRLAHDLLAKARDAVGPNPTALQAALLKRAAHLIRVGTSHIIDEDPRGLGPVWLGSVICYFLLQ